MDKVKVGQVWRILESKLDLKGANPEDYLIVITKIYKKKMVADFFYLDGYDSEMDGGDTGDDINIPWLIKNGQLESDVK